MEDNQEMLNFLSSSRNDVKIITGLFRGSVYGILVAASLFTSATALSCVNFGIEPAYDLATLLAINSS